MPLRVVQVSCARHKGTKWTSPDMVKDVRRPEVSLVVGEAGEQVKQVPEQNWTPRKGIEGGEGGRMENEEARFEEAFGVLEGASADAAHQDGCPNNSWFLLNLLNLED